MLQIYHVSTLYRQISSQNVRYCIVGAMRRRYFPAGETTGRLIAAPTRSVPLNDRAKIWWHTPCRVVLRAANQNPMIAGGDHTIIQRIVSARQRNKFLSRTILAVPGSNVANIPCFDMIPPNFIAKCSILHCRRFAPTLFSLRENNRAADSRPYMVCATELLPG